MSTNYSKIDFINVKKSYYHHLEESNKLIQHYGEIMKTINDLKLPSASAWRVILDPNRSFKSILMEIENIGKSIKEFEERVNKWQSKASQIYFDTKFPPDLNQPEMEVNYINQQAYLLNRMNQLIRDIQILYTSIHIVISDVQRTKDNAVNTRRYFGGIIFAIVLALI
jgi:hypothetical protein